MILSIAYDSGLHMFIIAAIMTLYSSICDPSLTLVSKIILYLFAFFKIALLYYETMIIFGYVTITSFKIV